MTHTFSLIVAMDIFANKTLAETLADVGCHDATVREHPAGAELLFDREAPTQKEAVDSAVADAERARLTVVRVEKDRRFVGR